MAISLAPGLTALVLAYAVFMYESPATHKTLTACYCAKCGSSALLQAFHVAMTGSEFVDGVTGKDLHQIDSWSVKGARTVRPLPIASDVHVHLVRDPFDRYVSAFHSKVRCCPGASQPCFPDEGGHLVRHLLKLSGNSSDAECMHMDGYAKALSRIHRQGAEAVRSINQHFKPQHLICRMPISSKTLLLRGPISRVAAPLLNASEGYNFTGSGGRIVIKRTHATFRDYSMYQVTPEARHMLCEVSGPEYFALHLQPTGKEGCGRHGSKRLAAHD
mmetsp:Transcript_22706/g.66923  ORF Transcript_22706/g.66923 Transcript_22706/m.66923 type:complete len:274 (-) Transcript_22706:143-964(-)